MSHWAMTLVTHVILGSRGYRGWEETVLGDKSQVILYGTHHDFQPLTFFGKNTSILQKRRDGESKVLRYTRTRFVDGTLHDFHPLTLFSKSASVLFRF